MLYVFFSFSTIENSKFVQIAIIQWKAGAKLFPVLMISVIYENGIQVSYSYPIIVVKTYLYNLMSLCSLAQWTMALTSTSLILLFSAGVISRAGFLGFHFAFTLFLSCINAACLISFFKLG